jgi:predicted DCC family thiol-disulfide oxidoreductase YuxK
MTRRLEIFIDGWCPNCRRFGKLIDRMDVGSRLVIHDIRKDSFPEIDIDKAKNFMASIDRDGIVSYGFTSIYKIFKTLPLLWIFVPVLFALNMLHLGDFLYNELAVRRRIIPLHCDDEECKIEERQ